MRSAIPQLYCVIDEGFSDIGRGLSLLDFRNFSPPYAFWVGSRVDDSLICSTKVEGTTLQSVAITENQTDAALNTC
jgi:hypothetical protein